MATITLLETARQRRLDAIASLGAPRKDRYDDNIVSIFDDAFDEPAQEAAPVATGNVIPFHATRVRHEETVRPSIERIAA